ncbi:MAG: hypothetical protein ACRCSV_05650 [Chlamydiales bacterium]
MSFISSITQGSMALSNAISRSQISQSAFITQLSDRYGEILKENQQRLKDAAEGVKNAGSDNSKLQVAMNKYNTDSQLGQNRANISSDFLSSMQSLVARTGQSLQQVNNLAKDSAGSILSFTTNLLASGA